MVIQSLPHDQTEAAAGHLRPINPARDLGAIARLIEIAFADELSPGGHAVMRELQTLNFFGPLLWLLSRMSPAFDEMLSGFVWEEQGAIVGNTTLTRMEGQSHNWIVSNVAVLPEYRRQGIARALVSAAVNYARDHHAQRILLQVRADNLSARRLYETLGFQTIEAVVEMQSRHLYQPDWPDTPHINVVPVSPSRWYEAYDVARAARPAIVQRLRPLRSNDYRADPMTILDDIQAWLEGHWTERWWAEMDGRVVAVALIDRFRGSAADRIEWAIHPDARGHVERALVQTLLARLNPNRVIRCNIPTYEAPLVEVLHEVGFMEIRTLEQMMLE